MKLNKNLILIGYMAAGKSSIGRLLAKKLDLKFFDTDFIVEKKAKMKIFEIFKKKGEPYFRNLEKKIVLSLLNKNNSVISLGGGAFNETVRKVAKKDNVTIWLNWSLKTLIDRIKKNKKRPVALNLSNNQLKNLLINRSKIYSKENYKIDCENMKKTEIVDKTIQLLKL